jgi:hypothetical protein
METTAAKATFTDDERQSITITIDSVKQILSVGDCISFNRVVKPTENPYTIGKILYFGYNGNIEYVNRIFYLPWRVKKNRWGSHVLPQRAIGLEYPYLAMNEGDWTTIEKLTKCPDQAGGQRKTRRKKKSNSKTRRHYRVK